MNHLLTIVIVTYNPNYNILNECLNSIDKNIKIIIIDNSKNFDDTKIISFPKNNILIKKNNNLGNGHGINVGINLAKSKYILYLDVDTILEKNFIEKIIYYAEKIENFAVLGPLLNNYNYKSSDYVDQKKMTHDWNEMNFIEGAIMLINKEIIERHKISFDENIFLYWEERDFFFQCIQKKQKIYLLNKLSAYHKGGGSIDKIKFSDIELNRNWHYMWSKFYFYKKNFNLLVAYKYTLRHFFSSLLKFLFFSIIKNEKKNKYYERLMGLVNSYLGKKSFRRPEI
tara:strand:- start:287 stop:1138 length:852 start_codon:yes stop_codon:yes gene_type:complete